jgi:hypothetical protein
VSERARGQARIHIGQYKQAAAHLRSLASHDNPRAEGRRNFFRAMKTDALRKLRNISPDLAMHLEVESGIADDLHCARESSPAARVAQLEEQLAISRGALRRDLEFLSTIPEQAERTAGPTE